jgi:hypothetical protein
LSKKLVIPQLFRIKQSGLFLYLLIINHTLAIIACFSNGLAIGYQLVALFIVIISAIFYWRDYKKFQPYDIRHNEALGWQLAKIENDYQTISILPTTVLTAQFIVLHFQFQAGQKRAVLIVNDALEKQDYRRLLVELKVSGLSTMT